MQWVIAALAAATVTAGFSLAALVVAVVESASSLARTFVKRISDLLDLLDEAGATARQLGEALRDTVRQLTAATRSAADDIGGTLADPAVVGMRRHIDAAAADAAIVSVGPDVHVRAQILDDAADRVNAEALVEAGKQRTEAEQDQG